MDRRNAAASGRLTKDDWRGRTAGSMVITAVGAARGGKRAIWSIAPVLLALAGPALAAGGWGEISSPAPGTVVHAGEWAEVAWSALPGSVEEFEILLSLDDGASFTIRLTEQLDPGIGTYRWLVPNFPSARARLQLRVGIDHHEIEGPLGEPFEIRSERMLALASVRWHEGEWWLASHVWPVSPLEPRSASFSPVVPARLDVTGAPTFRNWDATSAVAAKDFQASSHRRCAVRLAPPVTGNTPSDTPQRE